ncbi:Transposable element Tcb2 transposase [Araneus ventricosus]|uniref:Transposable element Tcb2 transposase n=1 Tax=Araneus ventricosus TaxID=182803 RepID=A0A4Y2MM95_ARAVE|nr:Transposable element Tcb2 transposase [Araneus ventricosus]
MSNTLLKQHLQRATGTRDSTQTVRNRLHHVGLYARRLIVCISLTAGHRAARRRWAQEYLRWGRAEWSNVLFTDESRFIVQSDNRRVIIWREHGTRNNPAFVHESVRLGGSGVMVWAGVSINGRNDLYIISNEALTAQRYSDEILGSIVVPCAAAIEDESILMDDNTRPQRARLVDNFLFDEGILRMDWPAYSPDMNPIEHV